MNEVFRPAENIRIKTRNSYLKLNHPFRKTSTEQSSLSCLFWTKFQKFGRKPNIWILSTKIKHYHLNDLSNPNLWNVGGFDYAFAVIKNFLFLLNKYFYIFMLFLLHSDLRTTMKIRLFACFVLSSPYCFSSH